jgi:hypothetical protein
MISRLGNMGATSDDCGRLNVSFWEENGCSGGDTDEVTVRVILLVGASSATEFKGKLAVGDSLVYIILCFSAQTR